MGKPSQITIKKDKNELRFLEKIITKQPLPKETVLAELRKEFVRVVRGILIHIESKGKKTDSAWVQQLLMMYALQYGSIRDKKELSMTNETKLGASDSLDMAIQYKGKAYALHLEQVNEMLEWLAQNPKHVKEILTWI